jgi:hypothetical protein
MVIVLDWDDDVQRYVHGFAGLRVARLPACPHCADPGHLVGHGSYPRTVSDSTGTIPIRVRRLRCAACRHTLSLLPSFCVPFRHYATATIQAVLSVRIEARVSWSMVRRRFAPSDLPTRTTCREWVGAFHAASARYLPALVRQLATWARRSVTVEVALADLGTASAPAAQVIAAVPHLLSWLAEVGHPRADGGRRWLARLWEWGNGAKLGRLV